MLLHLWEFKHHSYYLKYVIQFAANGRHLLAPYFTGSNYCWEPFTHRSQGGTCVDVKLSQGLTLRNCLKTLTPFKRAGCKYNLLSPLFFWCMLVFDTASGKAVWQWQVAPSCSWFSQREPHALLWAQHTWHCWTSRQGTRALLSFIIWEQRP